MSRKKIEIQTTTTIQMPNWPNFIIVEDGMVHPRTEGPPKIPIALLPESAIESLIQDFRDHVARSKAQRSIFAEEEE